MAHSMMMRIAVVALLAIAVSAKTMPKPMMPTDVLSFKAMASSMNVLPHINKTASHAAFALTYNTTSMTGMVTSTVYNIMSMTMAHIHAGNATSSGGVVLSLFGYGPGVTVPNKSNMIISAPFAVADLSAKTLGVMGNASASAVSSAFVSQLQSAGLYVNYHTKVYPGGEVRGQISKM